jgi:hypothetical protein
VQRGAMSAMGQKRTFHTLIRYVRFSAGTRPRDAIVWTSAKCQEETFRRSKFRSPSQPACSGIAVGTLVADELDEQQTRRES